MADVLSTLRQWSTTVGSNMPTGSTVIGAGLDDNLRQIQATVRQYLAAQASNMVSATTTDLSTADGFYVNITGTTTITGLGTEVAGVHYLLKFAAALTLTHNGTSLILPGAGNITTAAGDLAWVISEGSGNWRCPFYIKAASGAIGRLAPASADGFFTRSNSSVVGGVEWVAPSGALGAGRNIAARTNSGTPNSKIDISADELTLRNTSSGSKLATTVSVTIDITASGANGLDTGAEGSSTWYYGWAIAKEDGTVAGLLSTSATAPTMPAGYVYKTLVTAVRNDGSSNFVKFRQAGNEIFYENQLQVLAAGTATTETSVSLTSTVPSIALTFFGLATVTGTSGVSDGISIKMAIRVVTGADYLSPVTQAFTNSTGGFTVVDSSCFTAPNTGSFFYILTESGTSPTGFSGSIQVNGFKLPLGGE